MGVGQRCNEGRGTLQNAQLHLLRSRRGGHAVAGVNLDTCAFQPVMQRPDGNAQPLPCLGHNSQVWEHCCRLHALGCPLHLNDYCLLLEPACDWSGSEPRTATGCEEQSPTSFILHAYFHTVFRTADLHTARAMAGF